MNIIENNKLIASFMGWEEMSHTKSKNWMLSEILNGVKCARKENSLQSMKFSNSWDWLIPVVDKIESLLVNVSICQNNCAIYWMGAEPDLGSLFTFLRAFKDIDEDGENKLDATYKACINFIKQYNESINQTNRQ